MKLLVTSVFIISITIGYLSCSGNKSEENKQKPVNNVEPAQNDKLFSMSKYEFPNDNGIGPVKELSIESIDRNLAIQGRKIFNSQCISCHQLDARSVGPPLRNVTKKYTPVFIMNYLLNTTEMQRKDPALQKLVNEYKVIMPDQQLTRDDARAVLEYLRSIEK